MSMSRFNMIDPQGSAAQVSDRYRTMLEMASYMDENGYAGISLEEHHGVQDGWSPTPLMNAGMILSRTQNLSVTISALLLPLHDPVRVAEDIAVLDLISKGRISVILGIGYRPEEYHLHQKDFKNRGKLMDECVDTLLKAWTGEPFEYKGQEVQVSPKPLTQPHPMVMLGGTSKIAARRAARFGLPMFTAANLPELESYYNEQCKEQGTKGFCMMPSADTEMLFVHNDPDAAWKEFGQYFLNEAAEYSSWQTSDIKSQVHSSAKSPEELREEGIYVIRTPEQCLEKAAAAGNAAIFNLHPLCGGMPLEAGWESLKLFTDEVIKKL